MSKGNPLSPSVLARRPGSGGPSNLARRAGPADRLEMAKRTRKATKGTAKTSTTAAPPGFRWATSEETTFAMLDMLDRGALQVSTWAPGGRMPTPDEARGILEAIGRVRAAIKSSDIHAAAYHGFLLGQLFNQLSEHRPAMDAVVPLAKSEVKRSAAQREQHRVKDETLAKGYQIMREQCARHPTWKKTPIARRTARVLQASEGISLSYRTLLKHLPADLRAKWRKAEST